MKGKIKQSDTRHDTNVQNWLCKWLKFQYFRFKLNMLGNLTVCSKLFLLIKKIQWIIKLKNHL